MVRLVTVLGGTGFLGGRIVHHLRQADFAVRIATRHPCNAVKVQFNSDPQLTSIYADVNDDRSVAAVANGAWAVVNAISLYYIERGSHTFHSVHVQAVERAARAAREAGVERLAHLSGIGSNARSTSRYVRSRGQGEEAVRNAFPRATLIRPAVMFGRGDALVTPLAGMLRRMPVFPMFGRGDHASAANSGTNTGLRVSGPAYLRLPQSPGNNCSACR